MQRLPNISKTLEKSLPTRLIPVSSKFDHLIKVFCISSPNLWNIIRNFITFFAFIKLWYDNHIFFPIIKNSCENLILFLYIESFLSTQIYYFLPCFPNIFSQKQYFIGGKCYMLKFYYERKYDILIRYF